MNPSLIRARAALILSGLWQRTKRVLGFLRRHWKLSLLATLVGLPILAAVFFAFAPKNIEYVTDTAKREDLVQTVEANGTVTSDRDIELKFPAVSGVVDSVLVKEGDIVKAGQRLATLRAAGLGAAVASASASLQAQQAQLALMQQGSRPEDIYIAEAELLNKRASLEAARASLQTATASVESSQQQLKALRREIDTSLAGDISEVPGIVAKQLAATQEALVSIGTVLVKTDVQEAISRNANTDRDVLFARSRAEAQIAAALTASVTSADTAMASLAGAKVAMQQASTALQLAMTLVSSLVESSSYTLTERETDRTTLASSQSSVQTSVSAIDSALIAFRNASAGYDTQIVAEEASLSAAQNARDKAQADILTYESAVRISEAQLQLKRAGTRPEDIAAQQARVRQAQAEVARAAASYNDTILTAPIDGRITKVHVKKGEYTPAGAAMTLLGNSPYRIEMFVSEIDIPKVRLAQSGSILLDAFRDTPFALRLSEIDPAATDRDGVPKYKIVLDFVSQTSELKIGMTGDADIVTGTRPDVVTVPARAVLQDEQDRSYVRVLIDGKVEERIVKTGLDGSNGEREVEGVREGEEVIVLEKK